MENDVGGDMGTGPRHQDIPILPSFRRYATYQN